MKRFSFSSTSLAVQLVISFIALAILAAAAIGLPAIWLVRTQLDRQAWALIEQGSSTTQALYAAWQNDLANLAILTAQRPTLANLMQGADQMALQDYLQTLQSGSDLTLVALCGPNGELLAASGLSPSDSICGANTNDLYYTQADGSDYRVWMLSSQPVPQSTGQSGRVIVGWALDAAFLSQLHDQTGLEQTLVVTRQVAVTSFADPAALAEAIQPQLAGGSAVQARFRYENLPFYANRFSLNSSGVETLVALEVSEIAATRGRLTWNITAGILAVALVGSALGLLLARRIGRPLARLGDAAESLKQGDLSRKIILHTKIPEIARVGYGLEDARSALYHNLAALRQEKEWVEHLLESIVEGIVTLDQHNRITFFSRGAERISGLRQEQVIRRTIDEVFHPLEGALKFSQLMPASGRGQKIRLRLQNGRHATLSVTGASLAPPEAGKARVALVLRDVSDEEAVRRLLGDFLANIAHEFRTPLTALGASTELLLDQLPDLSTQEIQDLLGSLSLGILGLQTLIDNLLEGASIETGHFRVSPRPVDLREILGEATGLLHPLLEKYGQLVKASLPEDLPDVQADPRRTAQVLVNLLSNAIKHNPQGGEITLTVEASNEAGKVKVSIGDRGPGIPAEFQPDLFRRFARIDSDSRSESGAGLGLSVVKAIVEAQGGQVGVQDRPGGGAIFWFTLIPAPEASQTPEEAA